MLLIGLIFYAVLSTVAVILVVRSNTMLAEQLEETQVSMSKLVSELAKRKDLLDMVAINWERVASKRGRRQLKARVKSFLGQNSVSV